MTGNGEFIPPIKIVMTGEWFMTLFFPLNFPIRMAILGVIPSYPDPHQKNLDHSPIRQIWLNSWVNFDHTLSARNIPVLRCATAEFPPDYFSPENMDIVKNIWGSMQGQFSNRGICYIGVAPCYFYHVTTPIISEWWCVNVYGTVMYGIPVFPCVCICLWHPRICITAQLCSCCSAQLLCACVISLIHADHSSGE